MAYPRFLIAIANCVRTILASTTSAALLLAPNSLAIPQAKVQTPVPSTRFTEALDEIESKGLIQQIRDFLVDGQGLKALELSKKGIANSIHERKQFYLMAAIASRMTGNNEDAVSYANVWLKENPYDTDIIRLRADSYSDIGRFALAITDYSKLLELDPKDMDSLLRRATCKYLQGQYRLAISDYSTYIDSRASSPDQFLSYAHAWRGMSQLAINMDEIASQDFEKSISISPRSPDGYLGRSLYFARKNHLQRALSDVNSAIEYKDPVDPDLYNQKAWILDSLGEKDEACINWKKASRLGSNTSMVWLASEDGAECRKSRYQ
jgi:tetratricopeptide (TPR) repeat protein